MKYLTENSVIKVLVSILFAVYSMGLPANLFAENSPSNFVTNNVNGSQTLTGHVPSEVAKATFKYHSNFNVNAQIILPLGNQPQLGALLKDLYDPKSPNFHQFLTPTQFAQQFAPSSIDVMQVQEYLNSEGIIVTGKSQNGAVLNVAGPSGTFERAFGLHINNYQKSDGTMFFAPDADPNIPATLAGKILAVGGLDNLPKYKAHVQQLTNALPKAAGTGPNGFLAPQDVLKAYNLNSVSSTGSGQTIGLFELQGYSKNDITAYEAQFGVPNVPLKNVIVDGFSGVNYNNGAAEVTLDIEIAAAIAPGSSINVYEAPNTTQSWIDEWNTIAANNKVTVISCSWGEPELDSPTLNFDNNIFQQMAAQGQAVFVASGDSGAYDAGGSTLGVDEPADQPFVTGVGISKLSTNSSGAYSSESASLDGGGGISAVWPIPAYQTTAASQAVGAAKVSTTLRNVPDVSLTADPATAYAFYINGSWGGWWGSSIASPVWAAFISRVNQGLGANAPIGSVNAALYYIAQTSNYTNDFHSITTGNNGYYPAEPGFNDATGLGSFNGLNLYNDLLNNAGAGKVPSVPSYVEAFPGNSQVYVSGGDFNNEGITYFNVKRSLVSGGPYTTIGTVTNLSSGVYIDNAVVNGTTYYYVFSAVNLAGESPNSPEVNATPSFLPPAPGGLNVRVGGPTLMELNWNFGYYTPSLSFNVKRSTVSGGPYTTIANLPHLWSDIYYGYWDQSVVAGTTYYYVVSAVTTSGESPNSTQFSVIQTETITASAGSGGTISPSGSVNVNYGANQTFTVTPNTGYTASLTVDGSAVTLTNNTYSLNNVTAAHTVAATFSLQPTAPSTPVGLNVFLVGTDQVGLTWSSSTGATSYNVKRSNVSGGPYTTIASPIVSAYTDYPPISGIPYYYVVSAVNAGGESQNSSEVSATPVLMIPMSATAGSGGQISPSGTTWSTNYGNNIEFTVTPNSGYVASLTDNGVPVALTNNTYTLKDIIVSHTLVASFSLQTETVTASAGTGGMISPSGSVSVNYGANQIFTVTPNAGYIASLTVDGSPVSLSNNSYILNDVTASHALAATFTPMTFAITASAGNNGSITPTSAVVAYGGSQVFTLISNTGYTASLKVDGTSVTLNNNSYTLSNVTAPHTLRADFSLQNEIITASAGTGGTISPSGSVSINYGANQIFTLTPNAGYTASLTVDGTPVKFTSNTYTLNDVTTAHTLAATFTQITNSITASAGSNGSISPTSATVAYGGSQVFTLIPNTGYTAGLTVDGAPVTLTNNTYILNNVTAAHTLAASFSLRTNIITASAGTGGTISPSGAVSVNYGASQIFTVTSNTGYTVRLTVDGEPVTLTNNTYTLSNVTTAHTVAASFIIQTNTITASAGTGGVISPSGSVSVSYGAHQTFTVTPNAGYTASLKVDGSPVSLINNTYTLNNVIAPHTLSVAFIQTTFSIKVNAGSNGSITPTGATVAYGGSQVFALTHKIGYIASLTVDGTPVTLTNSNTYTLSNVTAAHTLAAAFTQITYSIKVSAGSNGSITPMGTTAVYDGSQVFTLTPKTGYVASLTINGTPVTLINNTYTLRNITAAYTLAAKFTPMTYSIKASAGSNGRISPTGTNIVNYGSSQVFTITPNSGYQIASVIINGTALKTIPSSYTFSNVTSNGSISVTFTQMALFIPRKT